MGREKVMAPGAYLKLLREKAHLKQSELANKLGYTLSYISMLERNQRQIRPQFVERLAGALELTEQERENFLSFLSTSNSSEASRQRDWGEMPRITAFWGRRQERATLKKWLLEDHCQLIALVGFGGVGKTALAAEIFNQIEEKFDYVCWRTLKNAPPLQDVLQSCFLHFFDQQEVELPDDENSQIGLLLKYLQDHRCLLVLDNMESVFQDRSYVGAYRVGYEGYGKLLQCFGESHHRSCLLLTSREKPKELSRMEGESSPVRCLSLKGLDLLAGWELLKDKGLGEASSEACKKLIASYAGNPLALQLVSSYILDIFEGDVAYFLAGDKSVFSDIGELLKEQFERLLPTEKEVMYWLAIEREAVSLNDLEADMLFLTSKRDLYDAKRSLKRRNLIEADESYGMTLQNVIMEFVTEHFVSSISKEIIDEDPELFLRHALVKAQSKEYVRETQIRLILLPVAEKVLQDSSQQQFEQRLQSILTSLRQLPLKKQGYGAGNVLNMLIQLHYDPRTYDFSHLAIRQADMRGIFLTGVNFAYADLTSSLFTSAFGLIPAIAMNPDGKLLAAGTSIGDILLCETGSDILQKAWRGHTDWISSVAFSSDGQLLASASDDETVRVWNIDTGDCLYTLRGHTNVVNAVSFSPDNSLLASSAHDQIIRLWDMRTGQCLRVLQAHTQGVRSIDFHPGGQVLISGGDDQTIRLWNVHTGQCLQMLQGHTQAILSVAFSPDGEFIASGGIDRTVRIWDMRTGTLLRSLEGHVAKIHSVAFSPDGQTLASASEDCVIFLWNIHIGNQTGLLRGHTKRVTSITFDATGKYLASGSNDQTLRLWDVSAGYCLRIWQGHINSVYSVACHPDGQTIASGGIDQTVYLWSAITGRCLHKLQGHSGNILSIFFNSYGLLASGSADQTIRIWKGDSGECLRIIRGHTSHITRVAFSPDGRLLASGAEDQMVRIWDVQTGHCLRILEHPTPVNCIAFSSDGEWLASGGDDCIIRIWDVKSGACGHILSEHSDWIRSLAFSPDGRWLASGSRDRTVLLWEVSTLHLRFRLQDHSGEVFAVAFSSDSQLLASGSHDQAVYIWEANTGNLLQKLIRHEGWVYSVCFSQNDQLLISGSTDGSIRLWNVETAECIRTLRSDRPYERTNIAGAAGLSESQRAMLIALGAIEKNEK